jgi:hypothetical protein
MFTLFDILKFHNAFKEEPKKAQRHRKRCLTNSKDIGRDAGLAATEHLNEISDELVQKNG